MARWLTGSYDRDGRKQERAGTRIKGEMEKGETLLERSVRGFVYTRTGERVTLTFPREGLASVRHVRLQGATTLAIFWSRVLQHPSNYPVNAFPYRNLYDKKGSHRLVLQVDSVILTVDMRTGELRISGPHAIDWLIDRLPQILSNYNKGDKSAGPQPLQPLFSPEDEKRLIEERALLKERWASWPNGAIQSEEGAVMAVPCDVMTEAERRAAEECNALEVEASVSVPNLLRGEALDLELASLQKGTTVGGSRLYRIWRSLLHRWFSDSDRSVYIVTPELDASRLADICHLLLYSPLTANLDLLAVPLTFKGVAIGDVRRRAISKMSARERVVVEHRVYGQMVYPRQRFEARLIAGIKDGSADVLVTSAAFSGRHFHPSCTHTALFLSIPEDTFRDKFLAGIFPTTPS